MENWSEDWIIFECLTGSQIYGTSTPESDYDYRGVVSLPMVVRNHLFSNFEQKDKWGDQKLPYPPERTEDRTIYELKKFMKICLDANPSVLELLFVPEKFWVKCKPSWLHLIANKEIFLSKKVKFTFTGYAHSQLSRIKRHRGWLLNPPKTEPTREGYGLPKNPTLPKEQLNAILSLPFDLAQSFWPYAEKERHYREAKNNWDMYMEWFKHRNPERAEMERKFGFDLKHSAHLIRLMHEGEELLTNHTITLPRPEAGLLMDIKNGVYSYDSVLEMAEGMDRRFEELYETSTLPNGPNFVKANEVYQDIIGS